MASRIPELSNEPTILRFYNTIHHVTPNTTDKTPGTDFEMSFRALENNYIQQLTSEQREFPMLFPYDGTVNSPTYVDQPATEAFSHRWFADAPRRYNLRKGEQNTTYSESLNEFGGSKMQVTFRGIELEYLFGDTESAAVFVRRSETSSNFFQNPPRITYDDILWSLRSKMFSTAQPEVLMTKGESSVYRIFLPRQ
jgi:hypothetical protein